MTEGFSLGVDRWLERDGDEWYGSDRRVERTCATCQQPFWLSIREPYLIHVCCDRCLQHATAEAVKVAG